jgi:hypothetical protein
MAEKKVTAPRRFNNPGALMGSDIPWDGMTGVDPATGMTIFDTPENGTRALLKMLYNAGHPQGNHFADYGSMTLGDYMTKKYAPRKEDTYGTQLPKMGFDLTVPMNKVDLAKLAQSIPVAEGYGALDPNMMQMAKAQLMSEGFAPVAGALGGTILPAPKPMKPGVK